MPQYDLIVVGAGSGGTGAAITAAREGMRVLWIEKEARLGGTGVNAYVSVFQAAYSASALAREISQRLPDTDQAAYLGFTKETPSGRHMYRIIKGATYEENDSAPLIVYMPDAMERLLRDMAVQTGRIDVRDRSTLLDARTECATDGLRRITSVEVQTPDGRETVSAPQYIDATADIYLARHVGCSSYTGREPGEMYGEPLAPAQSAADGNGFRGSMRLAMIGSALT